MDSEGEETEILAGEGEKRKGKIQNRKKSKNNLINIGTWNVRTLKKLQKLMRARKRHL